jgi:hypothetical protein
MIQFFRKIRQKLLSEGKAGAYFKYAAGEIVLVVIGILIALQINNWNEERKSSIKIHVLLENLVKSIEQDKTYLINTAVLHEFRSNSLIHLFNAVNKKNPYSTDKSISKLDSNTIWKGAYPDTLNLEFAKRAMIYSGIHDKVVIDKNVLDELKNTGLFSSLKNGPLKESINTYYSYVNRNFLIDDWNKDLSTSWRYFLRDQYGVLTMNYQKNVYDFIGANEPVQIRILEMISPAGFRSRNASKAITLADKVIAEIHKYQNEK